MASENTVYAIGETVLDVIIRDDLQASVRAGGSMLNTAVSLGRCGIPVEFISSFGEDEAGNRIAAFLSENNVSTRFCSRPRDERTTVALAFLDWDKNASYSFYRDEPFKNNQPGLPAPGGGDIVLFGSYFAISDETREIVRELVRTARQNGALILYDPNFRRPHRNELERLLPVILENISCADIVRASDEDCSLIFSAERPEDAFGHILKTGCSTLIYTMSRKGARVLNRAFSIGIPGKKLDPVSTVGAGDAFNAGIIYSLFLEKTDRVKLERLTAADWERMAETGIRFASDVCLSMDNYVSPEFQP